MKNFKKLSIPTVLILFTLLLIACSLQTTFAANQTINNTSDGGILGGIGNASAGDTVFLQSGTYNKTGKDTNFTISKNITIQGNGSADSVIIDAQGLSKIFTIGTGYNVTFRNITFINGKVTASNGGAIAINSNAKVTVMECNFINNTSNNDGGAIYDDNAANLTISGCNFTNNTANSGGGGVRNRGANLTIVSCNFINNTARLGGGLFNAGVNSTISDSNFTDNKAVRNGGGIYDWTPTPVTDTRNYTNLNFIGNSATLNGGAFFCEGGRDVNMINSTFINNTAVINGGSIFNMAGSNMAVFGNTMSGNTGGLGQMIYNNGSMGILNLTFIDNSTWIVKNGSTITLYATLVDDMGNTVTGQNISFYLDGIFFENVTSIEGYANTTYTHSNTGDIPVSGEYAGIGTYNIIINNGLLKVRIPTKITISVPKEVKVGDTVTLESKLTDENGNPIAGATVDFYVDGIKVGSGVTDSNGIAKLNYTFTKAGKPNIIAKYAGNDTYLASNATNSTTVSKIPTKITVETNEDTITATLTDENGNPLANKKVTITINGKTYTKTTNSEGQVIIKYKNAWDYKVTANFAGDEKYLASKATAPKRTPTKVTIKTEGDKITATLTDKNGKPLTGKKLTFRVKGVIIGVGITDANGQVVIYYKNANKKAVTVSFEGDSEYMPSSATSIPISDNVQASGKVAMKKTVMPVLAILLVLLTSIGLLRRRKRE